MCFTLAFLELRVRVRLRVRAFNRPGVALCDLGMREAVPLECEKGYRKFVLFVRKWEGARSTRLSG